jgi:hypothetical protein
MIKLDIQIHARTESALLKQLREIAKKIKAGEEEEDTRPNGDRSYAVEEDDPKELGYMFEITEWDLEV